MTNMNITIHSYKPCDTCVFNHEADGWNPSCSIGNNKIYDARWQTAAKLRAKNKDDSNVEMNYPCNDHRTEEEMRALLDKD